MLQTGRRPAIVDDFEAPLEQDIPEAACHPIGAEPRPSSHSIRREMLFLMNDHFAPEAVIR